MPQTLSTSTALEVLKTIRSPAFLIEVGFATVLRLATRGTLSDPTQIQWNNLSWKRDIVGVTGIDIDGRPNRQCTISIGNAGNTYGIRCLAEGLVNKRLKIWMFYGMADPALTDPVQIFDGEGAGYTFTESQCTMRGITNSRLSPRKFINRESGFNNLMPSGVIINWNGQKLQLTRGQ